MTRLEAQALLDRYLGEAPLIPAQGGINPEPRDQWFVGLVQAAYAQGIRDAQDQRARNSGLEAGRHDASDGATSVASPTRAGAYELTQCIMYS